MPLHSLFIGSGARRQLVHRQAACFHQLFQQVRVGPRIVQHPAAGGQCSLLPGAVVRHIRKGDAKAGQLRSKLLNLRPAGRTHLEFGNAVPGIRQGIQPAAVPFLIIG